MTKEEQTTNYRSKVMKGIKWNIIEVISKDAFKFILRLLLARLIAPDHFGLVGMAIVFTGLVSIVNDLGFTAALIQRDEKKITDQDFSTAFAGSLIFNIIIFLIMVFVVAPFGAWFYKEASLRLIIIVMSLPILLNSLVVCHKAKLNKGLDFKTLSIIEISSTILGGISAIILAALGYGVWSIALQGLISSIIYVPIMYYYLPWIPQLKLYRESFYDLFNFGGFVLLKRVTIYIANNLDYFIVGKMIGSYYLGVYTLAFLLTDVFRKHLMGVLNKVMFPVYSRVQKDENRIKQYYLKVVRYNALIIFPIIISIVIFANPLISIFFGQEWIEAIRPLQLLGLAVLCHVSTGSYSTVLTGLGKVKADYIIYLLQTLLITVPLLVIGINFKGIIGAALAILVSKFIQVFISLILMNKIINLRPIIFFKTMFPILLAVITQTLALLFCINFFGMPASIFTLGIFVVAGLILYLAVIYTFFKEMIFNIIIKIYDTIYYRKKIY